VWTRTKNFGLVTHKERREKREKREERENGEERREESPGPHKIFSYKRPLFALPNLLHHFPNKVKLKALFSPQTTFLFS
jgi:hypothetical protein